MRLTCACIIYCIFVKNNCFCHEEIKPFLLNTNQKPFTYYLIMPTPKRGTCPLVSADSL